jgi:hypothetical protein
VLVVGRAVEETAHLLLALAYAAWLGQAFAHRPLKAGTVGGGEADRGVEAEKWITTAKHPR